MKSTQQNNADKYISFVYSKERTEKREIYSNILFPYKVTFGSITVNIEDIFSETGTEDLKNTTYFHLFTILGNINKKTVMQGIYFKNHEIQKNFLKIHYRLNSLSIDIAETLEQIHEQHGRPIVQHSILYFNANK